MAQRGRYARLRTQISDRVEFIDENGAALACGYESGTKRKVRACLADVGVSTANYKTNPIRSTGPSSTIRSSSSVRGGASEVRLRKRQH